MIERQIHFLSHFVLEQRMALMSKVLALRTRYITVCLENIFQPQNASAVLRTCDAFGIQDVHIIEQNNSYSVNPDIALGTDKWLSLYKYKHPTPTLSAINTLRNNGYRIVATTPHNNSISLNDFDLTKGKTALFFGTELTGLTDEVMSHADEFVHIPMYGFVESFNISVSVGIMLHSLTHKLRKLPIAWQLSQSDSNQILLHWLKTSIRSSDLLLKHFAENEANI